MTSRGLRPQHFTRIGRMPTVLGRIFFSFHSNSSLRLSVRNVTGVRKIEGGESIKMQCGCFAACSLRVRFRVLTVDISLCYRASTCKSGTRSGVLTVVSEIICT